MDIRSLVTCLPSLHKVKGEFDAVIIDEIESVISMFNAPEIMNSRSAQDIFNELIRLLQRSETVFLLDAHIGKATMCLLKQARLIHKSVLLDCPGKRRNWIHMPSRVHHLYFMREQINQGKNSNHF